MILDFLGTSRDLEFETGKGFLISLEFWDSAMLGFWNSEILGLWDSGILDEILKKELEKILEHPQLDVDTISEPLSIVT